MRVLDTYALMAVAQGDPAFARYIAMDFLIPDTTLAEFKWVLMRDFSAAIAKEWVDKLSPYSEGVDRVLLLEAMEFRFEHRKKNMSFFDAAGFVFSKRRGYPFVTGDEAFRGMRGVEFVKSSVVRH